MKICILSDYIPSEGKGGAERVAWESALGLAKLGHEIYVITTTPRPLVETEVTKRDGIQIFSIHSAYHARWRAWRSLHNPWPVREVKRILGELHPDVVHAHNIHSQLSYHLLKVARVSGAKVFLTLHDVMSFHYGKLNEFVDTRHPVCQGGWNYHVTVWQQVKRFRLRYNPFRNMVIRHYLKYAGRVFAVSSALKDALNQNGIQDVEVLHNGVDTSQWQCPVECVAAFANKFGLQGREIILFGGRISGLKGGDAVLCALREVVKKVPTAALLIVGARNEYVQKLERQAREWDLEKNIVRTGWITGDELKAAYCVSMVVLQPSIYLEPFGLVCLEGMAAGKPVIGSCFGGVAEIILNGKTGFLVHPLNTIDFADRLTELLQDEEKCTQFGQAGLERARDAFSVDRHLARLIAEYSK